ncbi:MAG: UDP-N-acetylglucosamine--N-acetylmuramyl-(pentapeptide) pyrophosphoryl-undecaprenol N-acetylglucosamine transferase [Puniceicoccales bacterium]|jgi:UDP-N-acetylglucosamine--N-acetylmuramyl-(pentapeptide) pyrophosphoryl-undecaprenol N-acetylglucosamine transferase|nr:UDP-N-acetylglucosamine--N-acetylmuramyl-(pentapeptide) pyrophosphoryl-undecaprenol N-acetylglucosamine transferase [Puniceicoccales bacterium]
MNILLVSGGSGGHMAPAIAIAERLTEHRCIFITSNRKVDEIFSKKYTQFSFVKTNAKPLRFSPIAFFKCITSQVSSLHFALKFLKKHKIDLIISFGGFTSFVFVLAAKIKKIPSILYEPNVIPGKAFRLAAQFANKILLPDYVSVGYRRKKIERVGFPIRKEFVEKSKANARAQLGWPPSKRIILIIGGSAGATALNRWAQQNFMRFAHHNIDLYCIAGTELKEERSINFEDCTLHMLPFCENMNAMLRACDLVIARAGAGTIAECQFCKKPMILVPHGGDAYIHQLANGRRAEQQGTAIVIEQDNLDVLANRAIEMISNPTILLMMHRYLEKAFIPNAAEQIANIVEKFLQKRKTRPSISI